MYTRKLTLLLLSVLLSVATIWAKSDEKRVEIKVQNGEKWWGLVVDPSLIHLPFESSFVVNTSEFSPTFYRSNMLLSSRGRYLWSEKPFTVSYDGKQIVVTPPEGTTLKVEKSGRTLRESYLMCCHKNFPPQHVGISSLLFEAPIYELGGKESLLYTQESVLQFASMLAERGAPKGTILLPQGWNSPSGAIAFDPEAYPAPKEMIDSLHKAGMKVMLTVTPYVMAAGRGFQQSLRDGALLMNDAGEPFIFRSRLGYTACRALTPKTVEELNSALRKLAEEYGVDGFYFDSLDAIALLDDDKEQLGTFLDAWHTASNGIEVAIYSSPVSQQLGSITSSVSSTRDYTWQTLEESLERAIDASVLGFSRTTLAADLNFHDDNQQLILRTAQLAALMPVAIIPYSAWSLEDPSPLCKVLSWRVENGDYYLSLAQQGASSAEPIIRHLEYQFPRTGFTNCRDQFMIGSKWLAAPVYNNNGVRMVRLPKGRWKNWQSGKVIKGPRVIDVNTEDGKIALFEKID